MKSVLYTAIAHAVIFLLTAAFAVAEPAGPTTKPISDFELGKYQYCGSDRDCVKAVNGCCDCANGGADVAVNKSRLEAFRSRFNCLHVRCGEESRQPPCASGVVSCISHRCTYHEKEDVSFGN